MTFPIPLNALHGAVFTIASRIYNEESLEGVISEERLEEIIRKTGKFQNFLNGFDIKDPSSIVGLVQEYLEDRHNEMKVEEIVYDKTQVAKDWLKENVEGFPKDKLIIRVSNKVESLLYLAYQQADENKDSLVKEKIDFCETDYYTLVRVYDKEDDRFDLFILNEHEPESAEKEKIGFRKNKTDCKMFVKPKNFEPYGDNSIFSYCWERLSNEIRLGSGKEFTDGTSEVDIFPNRNDGSVPEYKGPLEEESKRIKKFHEHDHSANIMLYGKPGTGKSCFCRNFSKNNNYRTIYVPISIMRNGCAIDFQDVLLAIRPDLVIIDDFDSIWEGTKIENKGPLEKINILNEFNATTIFTVNDVQLLPDAIKRPGRIDRVVNAECTTKDERETVQKHLASLVGIDIDPKYESKIDEFHQKYSSAHLKHLYKQVKIFGWGDQIRWEYPYQEYE